MQKKFFKYRNTKKSNPPEIASTKFDVKTWLLDKIFPVVLGSLIFTGLLNTYNKKLELLKQTYDTNYNYIIKKQFECSSIHLKYIDELKAYAGVILLIDKHFNFEKFNKRTSDQQFIDTLKITIDTMRDTAKEVNSLFEKSNTCYNELNGSYKTLNTYLDINIGNKTNSKLESLKNNIIEKQDSIKETNTDNLESAMYGELDEQQTIKTTRDIDYKKIFAVIDAKVKYEIESYNSLVLQNQENQDIITKKFKERFNSSFLYSAFQ